MPIYEYECLACGERFDRLQKLSDPHPDTCPHCAAQNVRRRLTAPSFRLAGSGWYETDFKKDGDKKRNLAEKAEPAKTETKTAEAPAASAEKSPAPSPAEKPAVKQKAETAAKPAAPAADK